MHNTGSTFAALFRAQVNYRRTVESFRPTLRMRLGLWLEMRVEAIRDYLRKRREW